MSHALRTTALLAAATLALSATAVPASAADPFRILVFSKTTGFRHDSIPAGIAAIRQLAQQNALIKVEDPNHPSTRGLPAQFTRFDEWYDFQTNPRPNVHVLTTVDDSSYSGSTMGADHPTTWCHNVASGRSWYTALGHTT